MTMHEFFDLFYYTLDVIKNTFKFPTTVKEIEDLSKLNVNITDTGRRILENLYSQEVRFNNEITIPSAKDIYNDYIYRVPNLDSLRKSTINFFCPLLFNTLGMDNFTELLMSILTEKSILFVSENLNLLSSAV